MDARGKLIAGEGDCGVDAEGWGGALRSAGWLAGLGGGGSLLRCR